jgi:TetR/AcrR family transcriptional regulator
MRSEAPRVTSEETHDGEDGAIDARTSSRTGQIRVRNEARIIAAAEEVFAAKGYEGATTAEIALKADLPKANVHYYFSTKEAIYRAVIDNILDLWLDPFQRITEDDDPAEALSRYIRTKVMLSRDRPLASRIYANEIIRGAPILSDYLVNDLRKWVADKSNVLRKWAEKGLMDPVEPAHLLFLIWASTQHYADFQVQAKAVLHHRDLTDEDFETAVGTITRIVLKGCGVIRR